MKLNKKKGVELKKNTIMNNETLQSKPILLLKKGNKINIFASHFYFNAVVFFRIKVFCCL
jgi:hypothetical protein